MLETILNKDELSYDDMLYLMKLEDEEDLLKLYQKGYEVKKKYVKAKAYFRGLIEFSNICKKDCFYCGIRKSNKQLEIFNMDEAAILKMAQWALDNQYGSITLQAGERDDEPFIAFCINIIKKISELSNGQLGITLCLGEQTKETYQAFKDAGANRYL
ncbi:MAG: radical SAM protein [Bacilli bacterium]